FGLAMQFLIADSFTERVMLRLYRLSLPWNFSEADSMRARRRLTWGVGVFALACCAALAEAVGAYPKLSFVGWAMLASLAPFAAFVTLSTSMLHLDPKRTWQTRIIEYGTGTSGVVRIAHLTDLHLTDGGATLEGRPSPNPAFAKLLIEQIEALRG